MKMQRFFLIISLFLAGLYILAEKCTKFQLKSAPLIGVKDHLGAEPKVIVNDDKYDAKTRDTHPLHS
jgi:hypothetical protein